MNMNKIGLTKKEKEIIFKLANDNYSPCEDDTKELQHLVYLGLGKGVEGEFGGFFYFELTENAKAYMFENPELKNPSLLDDKKFWFELLANIIP